MPSILDMLCGDVAPTAAYARRSFVWVPADGTEPDGRDGTLTIVLQHSRRAGARQETDTYAVQRVCQGGSDRLGFYLINVTDASQEDVYECVPHLNYCTCKAAHCKVPSGCKHRDVLAEIIDLGGLED